VKAARVMLVPMGAGLGAGIMAVRQRRSRRTTFESPPGEEDSH